MCPPGVDQTERSPPRWTLLAPKLEQQEGLPGDDMKAGWFNPLSDPIRFLWSELHFDAFGKLARVAASSAHTRVTLPATLGNPVRGAASSQLEMLAIELVHMIAMELDVEDQIALALCSTTLWCHVLYQVYTAYHKAQAPWAGTPIICTSTHLLDLPETMLDVVPDVFKRMKTWNARIANPTRMRGRSPARTWHREALSRFNKLEDVPSLEALYHAAFEKHASASAIPQHIQDSLKPALKKVGLERKHWKLRNLDTREIVRFEVISAQDESKAVCMVVNGCPWLTLDFVLMTRICWTRLPHGYASRKASSALKQMERGAWAGNCFDVVEDVEATADDDGWRDITEEIEAEADLIKKELH